MKKEVITQWNSNTKLLNMLRRVIIIKLQERIREWRQKNNISYPLICTHTCVYQGIRNVIFSENIVYVLNE